MLYEDKIKNILRKRGFSSDEEIERFLNPSLDQIYNPLLLSGMNDAVERVNLAINEHQTVLIYGDYDADGICSVSMLYLFLKSKGLDPIAFIPNRHTDGYGLSEETVDLIMNTYFPDLIITVDTGISANSEIEMLQDCGADVIVTDHHEPPDILPNCIIIDPKLKNHNYPFNSLSGAGVVFKLIQAISGLNDALNYIDICAISTIGDIVPLLDENRIITKLGLEKINGQNARPSIAYLKKFFKIANLSSTDVAFKFVPRLNASGRMDSAFKCFEFLTSEDINVIEQKFAEIEADNNNRLEQSQQIQKQISEQLRCINLNVEPAIFIRDDDLNLGLIGIIASKLCNQYSRPVFIFTKDENGKLKASIRSIEGINVFDILDKHRDILVDVGGHSLAGGLTIEEEHYNEFKKLVQLDVVEMFKSISKNSEPYYDDEIFEKDININFAKALELFEPVGFQNPKPVFLYKCTQCKYEPMKSYKHFRAITPSKKEIISFFGFKYAPYFHSNSEKRIYLNIDVDSFYKNERVKATIKDITCNELKEIASENSYSIIKAMCESYKSILNGNSNYIKYFDNLDECEKCLKNQYGTMIITDDFDNALKLSKQYGYKLTATPDPSGKSCILYNPIQHISFGEMSQYNNMIFLDGYYYKEQLDNIYANTYAKNTKLKYDIDFSRETFVKYYKLLLSHLPFASNDIIELCESLRSSNKEYSLAQIAFTLFVCGELKFIDLKIGEVIELSHSVSKEKKELTSSKFYKLITGVN